MVVDAVERKLVAIVSADVAGYSRLISLDEVRTVRTLTAYREAMSELVVQHRGRVVDNPGDNALLEFPSATDAVECAIEIQEVIAERNQEVPADRRMEFRIGVHLGEVMVEDDRIYGEGVNVAARLEAMADVGGICISKTIRDQVATKVDATFTDLGEQTLKNIPEPVHAYRVGIGGGPAAAAPPAGAPDDRRAVWIAVLPFDNLSGDPDQDYFADGIAEDVITGLSAFRSLRVIARTSSFRYKDIDVAIPDIADELGVRFVLEGSVRKAGDRVRVTAQLIDAIDQHHVWADRYDAELVDIFDVQDQITRSIVIAVDPAIRAAEVERVSRVRPDNLDAWDHIQRGTMEMHKGKRDANVEARRHFRAAIDLDPGYSEAHAGLAWTYFWDDFLYWSDDAPASLELAYEEAKRAVDLDKLDAASHSVLAAANLWMGRLDAAQRAAEQAIQLNPSLSVGYFAKGVALKYAGHAEEGIEMISQAIALSPRDSLLNWFYGARAIGHFMAGQLEEAAEDARAGIRIRYGYLLGRVVLIAALAEMGRLDEARTELQVLLNIRPDFTPTLLDGYPFTDATNHDRERLIAGLRVAGLL